MKNITDGSFGFDTDILVTILMNLSAVLGVLIFFLEMECVRVVYFKE